MAETKETKDALLHTGGTASPSSLSEESDLDVAIQVTERRPRSRTLLSTSQTVRLAWSNLTVIAPGKRRGCLATLRRKRQNEMTPDKCILEEVSGVANPGELLAVMGASGAGKSTFMNVLSGRNLSGLDVSGSVFYNGSNASGVSGTVTAYVQQEDLFIGTLTVREHIVFHANLRLGGKKYTKQMRSARVEQVIDELGLTKCASTLIGIPGKTKSISGGEKKRLSFAAEILTNPPVLFVDEPTSGLDSFMAESIVTALKEMAKSQRTILCTIHQPASEIYSMFDRLLLLAEGKTVYLGNRDQAVEHFANLGYSCPEKYNPADYFVHILAVVPGKQDECKQKIKELAGAYSENRTMFDIEKSARERATAPEERGVEKRGFKVSWTAQFRTLFWRSWLTNLREPNLLRVKFIQTLFISILVGLVYLRSGDKRENVQNINGALFFFITQQSLTNMFGVIQALPLEMPVFMRERGSKMYRIFIYFCCKTLTEAPFTLLWPMLFTLPAYWMIGLKSSAASFFICYGILALMGDIAVSAGYIVSAVSSSVPVALAIGPGFITPFLLFGGLFVKSSEIPVYFVWFKYINWFYYSFEALTINEWRNYNGTCPPYELTCFTNGTEVINSLGFKEKNFNFDLIMLGVLIVGARIIAYLALRIRVALSKI
ncbi:protein white-like isoform X2 [Oscarella lobularis]|uniref:protein white-like isoform X2 n=1 Tax=Oscarella lobularis TaxID=121494 RepID=UPI00331346EC